MGEGGSLKVSLSIQNPETVSVTRFKDTGVNKMIVIALAEKVDESHENLHYIFSKIDLQNLCAVYPNFFVVRDLKLINIILGKSKKDLFYLFCCILD